MNVSMIPMNPDLLLRSLRRAACLEEGVVSLSGYIFLSGIPGGGRPEDSVPQGGRTWEETFVQGIQNSCNPVL